MKKIIKINSLILILVIIFNILFPILSIAAEDTVTITFQDEKLYNAILKELETKIESKDDATYTINITKNNLDSVTGLTFTAKGITDITGLENFKNLTSLSLWCNSVKDCSPIKELTELRHLDLTNNKVSDISFLENATKLRSLQLNHDSVSDGKVSDRGIKDISVLSNMKDLEVLDLRNHQVRDISPLKNLTKLRTLDLTGVPIADVEVLTNLVNLDSLYVATCEIDDKDLEYISNLTNLRYLNLGDVNHGKNYISNIEPIKNMTNLTNLNLDNNIITDISPLKELTKLKSLSLRGNNISNLEPLSGLTGLTSLSLGRDNYGNGNPIDSLEPISNLTNLTSISIAMCNVSNVTPLSKLTKLTTLDLTCNEVQDISALSQLTELTSLELWGNKINNIEPLKSLTKLTSLDIGYNEISDISILEQMDISRPIINSQKIIKKIENEKVVELPKIFIQAKDKNSKAYTDKEWILTNCKLSDDGTSVIVDDNVSYANVTIGGERYTSNKTHVLDRDARYTTLEILINDNIPPQLDIQYSTKELTKESVIVTVKANERIQQIEGWNLEKDKMAITKVYAKNAEEEITVLDLAGNKSTAKIEITNIDKNAPEVDIKYTTTKLTNENVIVTIVANEQIQNVDGWTIGNDKKTLTKGFEKNEEVVLSIYDLAGNERKVPIKISNIDKVAPIVEIQYSTKELTKDNVRVTISSNEEIQETEGWIISTDRKKLTKEYEKNEEDEIIIYDLAGNSTKNKITISNIDKDAPELEILYSTVEKTNETVTVIIKTNEKIQKVDGWELQEDGVTLTKIYEANAREEIIVYDLVGNGTIQEIEISNIFEEDTTVAETEIPKAGLNMLVGVSIIFIALMGTVLRKKYNNMKDIK